MAEELMPHKDDVSGMRLIRAPEAVMADAERAAKALVAVVSRKPRKVIINNEQYLEFEDWQTVAQFYRCTVRVAWTRLLEIGSAKGFEAGAEVIDRTGRVISAAEAMCLNDEERWSTRPKYEWQDGKRIRMGEEIVPLFQLRSMAQTRACAKALRNVFAWVVVLAGYKPTPAEEMTGHEQPIEEIKRMEPPKAKEEVRPMVLKEESKITPQQAKAIFGIARSLGIEGDAEVGKVVADVLQVPELETVMILTKAQASEAIKGLQAMQKDEAAQ